MTDRLKKRDGVEPTLLAIKSLAMRAAVHRKHDFLWENGSNASRAELYAPPPTANSQREMRPNAVAAAAGWDSESVGDPFKVDGPEDNLLGEDGEDPFGSWPSVPPKETVKKPDGDEKESDNGYIDFSLEGILDEALKVEDQDVDEDDRIGQAGNPFGLLFPLGVHARHEGDVFLQHLEIGPAALGRHHPDVAGESPGREQTSDK